MNFRALREGLADLLRSHGIAPTHQRIEIAHVLFERKQHLSAEQILAAVNARHAATSKATVYNTLRLFLEKKLVRELVVDPTRVFYDPNTAPHHHFYDVVTGALTDIPAEAVRIADLPPVPPAARSPTASTSSSAPVRRKAGSRAAARKDSRRRCCSSVGRALDS
jgi:Fur family iron response transcriptional regulator